MTENRLNAQSRRDFVKVALAVAPGLALFDSASIFARALAQAKPNSLINGVQVGAITYSFRSMPDQSAEATLKYCLDSGISAIELMGDVVERYAGIPSTGRGGGGGRGAAGPAGTAGPNGPGGPAGRGRGEPDPSMLTASWNGVACAPVAPDGGARGRGRQGTPPANEAAALPAPGGARGGGRGAPTPEQQAATAAIKAWRTSVSMDKFKALRKMYNDAGVTIYAWKQLGPNMSDEEFEYIFNVAEALGCTHTTLELTEDEAALKRIGDFALRKKIYAAYHTHTQGSMTAFDKAFAASKGNMANVDLGHYVAGGNVGGTALQFLEQHHDRTASFHLKDRTTPANCALNLPWGTGETPIGQILQLVRKNRWTMPASIELEYRVPDDSDAVREVAKCLQFCRQALA